MSTVPKEYLDLLPVKDLSTVLNDTERNAQWLHDTKARGKQKGVKYADKLKVLIPELNKRLVKTKDEDEKTAIEAAIAKAEGALMSGYTRASVLAASVRPPRQPFYTGIVRDVHYLVDQTIENEVENSDIELEGYDHKNLIDNNDTGEQGILSSAITRAAENWDDLVWDALIKGVEILVGKDNDEALKRAYADVEKIFGEAPYLLYQNYSGSSANLSDSRNSRNILSFDVDELEDILYDKLHGIDEKLQVGYHDFENSLYAEAQRIIQLFSMPEVAVGRGPDHDNIVYRYAGTNASIGGASAKGMYVAKLGFEHLRDESKEMGHCIGNPKHGHPQLFQAGLTEVYSIRTPVGKTKFTIERLIKEGRVTEVKGNSNRLPGYAASATEMTKPDDVRLVVDFLVNYLKMTPAQIEGTTDIRAGVLAMKAKGIDPFSPPPVRKRPPPPAETSAKLLSASMEYAVEDYERSAVLMAAPYDGWKDLKPGKLPTPVELEDAEGLWKAIAERIGHDVDKGVEMRAPIIGGRKRYHHRPLRSYHLSNNRTLTVTTDEMEAKTWNNLKAKRHPSMPRIYDVFSIKKKGEPKAKLWAIVHEQLTWPVEKDWDLFIDSFFKWRAMEREALSPAKATDLEGFLRWVIDPETADPKTTQKHRIEVVLPWKMTRQRRDDVADRRKKLFALPDLEEKIKWAKSALKYLHQNKVQFRDFDPSNLAMTVQGDRAVITNLAESRSIPTKTGRTGRVKGSTADALRAAAESILISRKTDEQSMEKAVKFYGIIREAMKRPDIESLIQVTTWRGIRLPLASITDDPELKHLTLVVHQGPDSFFYDKGVEIVLSTKFPWMFSAAEPKKGFVRVVDSDVVKSTLLHELVHFVDFLRIKGWDKAVSDYPDQRKDYAKYANHPVEMNAYFQQSIADFVKDYKATIEKIEDGTGPENDGSADHQTAVWRLMDTAHEKLPHFMERWQNKFNPNIWKALSPENQKKMKARAYQLFDRITSDAKKRLKVLVDRGDPMATL